MAQQQREQQQQQVQEQRLRDVVAAVTHSAAFESSRWGVCAQWLGRPTADVVDVDAGRFFTPASNTKMFTLAAAQDPACLGSDSRLETSFWLT